MKIITKIETLSIKKWDIEQYSVEIPVHLSNFPSEEFCKCNQSSITIGCLTQTETNKTEYCPINTIYRHTAVPIKFIVTKDFAQCKNFFQSKSLIEEAETATRNAQNFKGTRWKVLILWKWRVPRKILGFSILKFSV